MTSSRRTRRTERSRWWTTFLLVAALSSLWLLATPLFGAPDEPAHAIRAASVVRLDVVGDEVPRTSRTGWSSKHRRPTATPPTRSRATRSSPTSPPTAPRSTITTSSYAFPRAPDGIHPRTTSSPGFRRSRFGGALSIYLMRIVSVLITAAFVASAVRDARATATAATRSARDPHRRDADAVLHRRDREPQLRGDPGGALALDGGHRARRRGTDAASTPVSSGESAVAAIALVLSRQLAPLWLALIAAALVAVGGTAMIGAALWASRTGAPVGCRRARRRRAPVPLDRRSCARSTRRLGDKTRRA